MSEGELGSDARELAEAVGELLTEYQNNIPDGAQPGNAAHEELQRRNQAQHAQELYQQTRLLWDRFNESYRDDAVRLLEALDERGFETRPLLQRLDSETDPRVLKALVTELQEKAAELETESA